MLFFGHAASILASGYFSRQMGFMDGIDLDRSWIKKEQRRWRRSIVVVGAAFVYPFLFYAPNFSDVFWFYEFSAFVAAVEILVLTAFLLYLSSFTSELVRFERYKRGSDR